jgi:hypothetical protein
MYKFFTVLGVYFCLVSAAGAQSPFVSVAGIPVYCTAPNGAPVVGVFDPSLQDVGQALLYGQQPVIRMNPYILQALPPIAQVFFYAHECGHHLSGDVINGYTHNFINPNTELRADMIGIRMVRDQMHPSQDQLLLLEQVIKTNPKWDATHLPGPMRAQWIRQCYWTDSENCL